jgi:hypothetical protein
LAGYANPPIPFGELHLGQAGLAQQIRKLANQIAVYIKTRHTLNPVA